MIKEIIHELNAFGQSAWLDNISRPLIETGELKAMIDLGLRGITSNPTIFDKAISSSADYDDKILELCSGGKSTFEIYDELTVRDVRDAADMFLPVYKKTQGLDGYVSLEINPKLAYRCEETIEEGKRLFRKLNRPNIMLKVPATEPGFKAIEELSGLGMNINATLIFSLGQYTSVANAYIRGMKKLLENRGDLKKIHSVASVFVSRIDTSVDSLLDKLISNEQIQKKKEALASLKGKAAVSNSGLIYKAYSEIFSLPDYLELKERGANLQRVLWASTSTKNPDYSDIKYVSSLIAKNTVNTMPDNTFSAFLDHGKVAGALTEDDSRWRQLNSRLTESGIDVDDVCAQLLKAGVSAFEKSFDSLLLSLEKKKDAVCKS